MSLKILKWIRMTTMAMGVALLCVIEPVYYRRHWWGYHHHEHHHGDSEEDVGRGHHRGGGDQTAKSSSQYISALFAQWQNRRRVYKSSSCSKCVQESSYIAIHILLTIQLLPPHRNCCSGIFDVFFFFFQYTVNKISWKGGNIYTGILVVAI